MPIVRRVKVGTNQYQDIPSQRRDPNACYFLVESKEDRELWNKYDRLVKRITRVGDSLKLKMMLLRPRHTQSSYGNQIRIECPSCGIRWFVGTNSQITRAICDPESEAAGCGAIITIRRLNASPGNTRGYQPRTAG